MQIICNKGFYKFYPETSTDLILFQTQFKIGLVKVGDFWTFPKLAELPDFSIKNQQYGDLPAIVNYASCPERVLAANNMIYDVNGHVIRHPQLPADVGERNYNYNYLITGLPPAHGKLKNGRVIIGFSGYVNLAAGYTIISEWDYENN